MTQSHRSKYATFDSYDKYEQALTIIKILRIDVYGDVYACWYRHDCVGGEKICGGSLVQRILIIKLLRIVVYGQRLTLDTFFAIKTELLIVKCFTCTLYKKDKDAALRKFICVQKIDTVNVYVQ